MIKLDENTQDILIEWTIHKLALYESSSQKMVLKQNKNLKENHEILENIRKVLVYSKPEELVVYLKDRKKSVLLYYFFYIFINITCPSLSYHVQISLFQTLNTWLSRCIQSVELFPVIKTELLDIFTDSVWKKMYDFIWERWEISSTMQNILREFFTKMLSLQKSTLSCNDLEKSLSKILYKALNENISIKASAFIIDILVKFLGIDSILEIEPDFFIIRVLFLKNVALAPALSRMLVNFLAILRHDLNRHFQENSNEIWVEYWLPHVIECFCKKDYVLEQNITKWLLPGIFGQSIDCYKIVIDKLKDKKYLTSDQYLCFLIAILKVGNDSNVFQGFDDENLKAFGLFQNTISDLLNSLSMLHRLSVLSLIVENSKLSTPISPNNLDLIMVNLPKLIIDSDASSRNSILDIVNKILLRLSISSHNLSKNLRKIDKTKTFSEMELTDTLLHIERFILWLYSFVKSEMSPGLSYTRVVTALNIIKSLIDSGIDSSIPLSFEKKTKTSFHFSLKIFDTTMVRILTDQFMNAYEEPQKLAMELLCISPFPIDGLAEQEELTIFFDRSLELAKSNRAVNAEGGARALLFIFEKIIVKHRGIIKTEKLTSNINILDSPIKMIQALVEEFDNSIHMGSKNLFLGANSFPLHGILLTLQYIFNNIYLNVELYVETEEYCSTVYKKLICFCENIWKNVSSVLSSDLCGTFLSEDTLSIDISKDDENNKNFKINDSESSTYVSQIILTYSWRAIKEASSLLAIILSRPLDKTNQFPETIYEQYIYGGKLFKEWLENIRHPGAISAIYPNFITICSFLFALSDKKLKSLPETWLQEIMSSLKKQFSLITRRSGGLPYYITGILASEIDNAHPLLLKTMDELIKIAESDTEDCVDIPRIHTFNILRIIFLETRLSNISTEFIEKGFILSINGFKSNTWAIRNSSMMLFNALLTRALGSRKYKQDYVPTTKTISTKTFFNRYSKLKEYLLQQLKNDISQFNNYNNDIIYIGLNPVLTLISYFEVAIDYSNTRWTGMDEFIPLLDHCCRSNIWKVREISAKAIPAIISPSMRIATIIDIIECCDTSIQNTLHGNLLKVKYLIQSWINHLNSKNMYHVKELKEFYTNVANVFIKKFNNIIYNNPCAITKNLVLEIIYIYFIRHDWIKENVNTKFEELALKEETVTLCFMTIEFCINLFESEEYNQKTIGRDLFLKQASIILLYGLENFSQRIRKDIKYETIIIKLLDNTSHDVKLAILDYLEHTTKTMFISPIVILKTFKIIFQGNSMALKKNAALSLFNLLNISSFSSLNMHDLKTMATEIIFLLEDPYNMHIKDVILLVVSVLLYKLWYIEPKDMYWEQFNIWVRYLDLNSNEDKDLIKRMSVIQSLKCFSGHLILNNVSSYFHRQQESIIPLYFILLKLLKDDDQKIRELASETFSRIISAKTIFSPVYSSELLLNQLSIIYKSSPLFKEKLLDLLVDSENINKFQSMLSYTQNNDLFIHEKKNLWKDNIGDDYKIIKTLALLDDDDGYIINKLISWANSFSKILLQIIIKKGYDGHLGWTSNGDIYSIISKFIYIVQYLELTSNKENMLYLELRNRIEKIIIKANDNNVHKYLFNLKTYLK
ncbi:hypothetical protein PORY_000033 [Pneumocystis oryctolagi]|uniref:Uncharacterized protein n=1 Tax=Pneumocystis oryctolagi TaxID=42067 RepID=A0ACB7CF82_9ASCO|nr:hypothetical protein PORY_000033 [Pneumocystis oryctolagi]